MRWSEYLERFSDWTGRVVAWLLLPVVIGTFLIVLLRYVFDLGWIWMQEAVIWMHAAVFMLAAGYTLARDEHVRVDVFYRGFSAARRAIVDILGTVLLLLPMMIFLFVESLDYVVTSWRIAEASREAGGLPYPFVPLLKSVIPLTAVLVMVQAAAVLLRSIALLRRRGSPSADEGA